MRIRIARLLVLASLCCGPVGAHAETQDKQSRLEPMGVPTYIQVGRMIAKERSGLMSVQAEFVNAARTPQTMYWRVRWLDNDGFQVWPDEVWKPLQVLGESRQLIQATAPTAKARDFVIQYSAETNRSATSN